jgi:beta-lactamase regulating signal transducer with metallopeptidase domain
VALLLRNASAAARVLLWRAAIASLLVIFLARFVGRALPDSFASYSLPDPLSAVLVALGRIQVSAPASVTLDNAAANAGVAAILLLYLCGVALVLAPTARAWLSVRDLLRLNSRPAPPHMQLLLDMVARANGLRRTVRLRLTSHDTTPLTIGMLRPVVLLPDRTTTLNAEHLRALLLHETAHIRSNDWIAGLLARCACALYWFHPAVWFIARSLRDAAEVACDDAVLRAGVRPSDHAQVLLNMAARSATGWRGRGAACAFLQTSGLRNRIALLARPERDLRMPGRATAFATLCLAIVVALPMGTARIAPTRETLQRLMQDVRWESRAWAVQKLAQRADSIETARAAALSDPSPRVRASARAALARHVPHTPGTHP